MVATANNLHDLEKLDPRARSPLLLSVTLGRLECTKILLKENANVNVENKEGFSVLHEAISTGDPELIQEILERRDYQRYSSRVGGIPELLKRIRDMPDFYVEMKWEFTSWVPLVSRMCPSDTTYKVYKSGSNVRIDTTLLGFDQSNWQRGSRSYVFKGQEDSATMMEIDHESGQVYVEQMRVLSPQLDDMHAFRPTTESVSSRLTTPIVTTFVDTDKINFERNKPDIWGRRSDRNEIVNGHESKVFSVNNVESVTKTRTEHLTEADKIRHKTTRSPLQSLLGIVEVEEKAAGPAVNVENEEEWTGNPCHIPAEEYFNSEIDLGGRDIGRPREISTKIEIGNANLWLCENYPLSLPEQILPIVDLMAIGSTHFAKLRDFITLQLPAGFPVKIEIPLFHVLNARITFGNIFAHDEAVQGVTPIQEEKAAACVLDGNCFDVPAGYVRLGSDSLRPLSIDEDEELLLYAIQQSLMEAGSEEDPVIDVYAPVADIMTYNPTDANLEWKNENLPQFTNYASLQTMPNYASNYGISSYNVLMKIVQTMRERHLAGDHNPLSLQEILIATEQTDISPWMRNWLETEALLKQPKLLVNSDSTYVFKPPYNIKDGNGLLKLLKKTRGLGGIDLDDVKECIPNVEKTLELLGDSILTMTLPLSKKIFLHIKDENTPFNVDDDSNSEKKASIQISRN